MEHLLYIIIGLYVWEVYLETYWYKLKDTIITKVLWLTSVVLDKFK
jgi:hypothetical protein